MKQLANGMRKKPMSRHGVFVLYREILIPNIIIVCFNHRIKKAVEAEMREKTSSYQNDKLEFIKNPVVVEFLGLTPDASFDETKLESSIITNLQKFLMEMGKGYAFVVNKFGVAESD